MARSAVANPPPEELLGKVLGMRKNYEKVAVLHGAALQKRVGALQQLGLKTATMFCCNTCKKEFVVPDEGKHATDQAWRRWSLAHPLCAFPDPVRTPVHPPPRARHAWHARARFAACMQTIMIL